MASAHSRTSRTTCAVTLRWSIRPSAGVRATSVRPENGGGYAVETTVGIFRARTVVVATGLLQQPRVPSFAAQLPGNVQQMHASRYRNPSSLPVGNVLVVGLAKSGPPDRGGIEQRSATGVPLLWYDSCRLLGRYRGKSKAWWVLALGLPVFARAVAGEDHFVADPGGGHEYNPHQFARDGMTLLGSRDRCARFNVEVAPNLYDCFGRPTGPRQISEEWWTSMCFGNTWTYPTSHRLRCCIGYRQQVIL